MKDSSSAGPGIIGGQRGCLHFRRLHFFSAQDAGQCLISFDRWNSSTLVTELTGDGVLMALIGMGYASQFAPLRELERFTVEKKLVTSSWTKPGARTRLMG